MTTLAKFMIIAGADNRPPMLEKSLYDSWKSCMELYIENQENGRMVLNSIQNGPLIWPTVVKEDGTTRTKKCLSDESLVILLDEIYIDDKLHFVEEPVEIMDREVKQLKKSRIPIVNVR
ncbi:hypothetical protein Tco_1379652 [Tanacetum coccineum]